MKGAETRAAAFKGKLNCDNFALAMQVFSKTVATFINNRYHETLKCAVQL